MMTNPITWVFFNVNKKYHELCFVTARTGESAIRQRPIFGTGLAQFKGYRRFAMQQSEALRGAQMPCKDSGGVTYR